MNENYGRISIAHILPAIGRVPRFEGEEGAGGISSGTLSLANVQQRAGHEVSILSWTPVRTEGYRTKDGVVVNYATSWNWAKCGRWDFRWILPAFARAMGASPDILHVHSDPNLLLLTRARARVFHIRTPVPRDPPGIYRRLVAKANAVVCNSHFTARSFLNAVQYPESRVFVAHNGADESFFNPQADGIDRLARAWPIDHDDITVVSAGALVEEKGAHHAIEAVRSILTLHRIPLRLIIVGSTDIWPTVGAPDGRGTDHEQELKYRARGLPVYFAGALSRDDMPNALALADVVVVPSLWEEPFGTIVCEAMAAGKPVVAYRSGGIVEIVVDGETGFLVAKGDIGRLAEAILLLASDAGLRVQMGCAGRKRARERFTWDKTAERLNEIYSSILDCGAR